TPAFYTLSLHDALPIFVAFDQREIREPGKLFERRVNQRVDARVLRILRVRPEEFIEIGQLRPDAIDGRHRVARLANDIVRNLSRSEEHTSELQSRSDLV